jgi:hypothetical protein
MKVTKSKKVYLRLLKIQDALNEVNKLLADIVIKEQEPSKDLKKEVKKTRRKKKE